jgi:hypothetical protein
LTAAVAVVMAAQLTQAMVALVLLPQVVGVVVLRLTASRLALVAQAATASAV